jgi:hypothetical protein
MGQSGAKERYPENKGAASGEHKHSGVNRSLPGQPYGYPVNDEQEGHYQKKRDHRAQAVHRIESQDCDVTSLREAEQHGKCSHAIATYRAESSNSRKLHLN